MNKVYLSVQTTSDPREVYVDSSRTNVVCDVLLPPLGNKAPTPMTLNIYGAPEKQRVMQSVKKDMHLFVAGAKVRHDLQSRAYSLHGGSIAIVSPENFPIINEVILSGRCIKNIDPSDKKQYNMTPSGFVICNQTLSVATGKQQADLFNFYAINKADDRYNQATLLLDMTRKGTGLTIYGKFVTDNYTKDGHTYANTKVQLYGMTLAPKNQEERIKPSTELSSESKPVSLWGGQTLQDESPHQDAIASPAPAPAPVAVLPEPWGMPDLPASNDDEAPF
jgi:hypothetical protein